MDTVRIGLVGCGGMGRALFAQAATLDYARIVAVSDLDEARRGEAAEQFGCEGIADFAALIARDDIDAVFVATPGGYHREVVEAAAAAGKHIFSEKPLATSVEDCDAMIAAVERAGVKHATGQVCRFHPTHLRLKQMMSEGPLGPVLGMYVERLGARWAASHPTWRLSYKLSGGALMEINAHEIDFMLWLAGPVKRVSAVGGQMLEDRTDYPDLVFVSMTFESGAVGVLQSSSIATLGSYAGRFDCMDGSASVAQLFGGPITYKLRDSDETKTVTPEEMKVETPVLGEVRAFLEALRNGSEPPVTFQDGRAAVQVAEAAYQSVESGQPIELS
ncbi:MAG: Gfo/Idh/MocA family oxidoreductase [Armatimonadetes bacterium]|nr:Gfo/Idh/MocA family oxidoreductase [Armatimonadota bacterium]